MVRLLACTGCARHVRAEETVCPFCGQSLEGLAPRPLAPLPELSRAAAVFIGAAAVVGCGKEAAPPPPPAPITNPNELAVPAYGPPPNTVAVDPTPPPPPPPPPDAAPPPPASDAAAPLPVPVYGPPPQLRKH